MAASIAQIEASAVAMAENIFAIAAGEIDQDDARFAESAAKLFANLGAEYRLALASKGYDKALIATLATMAMSHGQVVFETRWRALAAALAEGSEVRQ
jgi:hypothetical protein